MKRALSISATLAAAATALTICAGPVAADPPPVTGPIQPDWWTAMPYSLEHPEAIPQGMNDWNCTPNAAHPRPLILVHGYLNNVYPNWSMYSPALKADGYCVFGLSYGGAEGSPIQAMGNMRASAGQLAQFVDRVLAATGTTEVDLVGHSEGGLLSLYYINNLGGADKVNTNVGLEPATNGIAFHGLLPALHANPTLKFLVGLYSASGQDFTAGSPFVREVAANGMTRPQVRYTTIMSATSLVITVPEGQLPPGPNVENVVIQDVCAEDHVDHVGVIYDDISLRLVRNALDPATAQPPVCHPVSPLRTK
ncbi:esterase/lipase family protein [Nocardia sp. A7]|uniref:esterase/lipase family protein n=1 Tax=Nocardia sp. A7 TaxID=2789274 RepID=UPI00397949BB